MPVFALLDPKRHDRTAFVCGETSLDRYLREQAAQHHRDGIATTHVALTDSASSRILGYYTLSAAQALLDDLQDADRRRLPRYPIPAARLARLAIAHEEQRKGLGGALLAHAVQRCLQLRAELGVRLLIVDALNERAARFYEAFGFRQTTSAAATWYLSLGKAD